MVANARRRLTVTLCLALAPGVAAAGQLSDAVRSRVAGAVVMIRAESQTDGRIATGAGLIVGASSNRVDIATARHLFADGGSSGVKVSVQFGADLKPTDAEMFPVPALFLDEAARLDLAIVRASVPPGVDAATFAGVGAASSRTLAYAAPVYHLGFGGGVPWNLHPTPDRMKERSDSLRVIFGSTTVRSGDSGGALLDQCGRIVGMITQSDDTAAEAEAVRIERVLLAVGDWLGRAPALELSSTPCGESPPTTTSETGRPADPGQQSCEVTVDSTPSDADVFLNGRAEGTTPRRLRLSRGTEYQVRVEKGGYEPFSFPTDCLNGAARPLHATLRALQTELAPTEITLSYKGDPRCQPRLTVQIGPTRNQPTSYPFRVAGLPTGEQPYSLAGQIACSGGMNSCTGEATGSIFVWPGADYDVSWFWAGFGQCGLQLFELRP